MKEMLNLWIGKRAQIPGVIACVVRYPDKSIFVQSWSTDYSVPALENTWRTASESFQFLELNRLPSCRLHWCYEHAYLHAARRSDGICFGILTSRDLVPPDLTEVEATLTAFEHLKAAED